MLSQYCNTYNVYLNLILEISAKSILDTPVPNEIGLKKKKITVELRNRQNIQHATSLLSVAQPMNFETKD